MFNLSALGPKVNGNTVCFRIALPSIEQAAGFSVKVLVISKQDQFNPRIDAAEYPLAPAGGLDMWGDLPATIWQSKDILLNAGAYLYRFEITGPVDGTNITTRSLYFGDPCARETDSGVFSVVRIGEQKEFTWEDAAYRVPPLDELIIYELNVAEFGRTFQGITDRIPYLKSLGINVLELMPISSIAEPTRWGYMPIFHFAPEERFGPPDSLRRMVDACHRNGIAVILDMVFAHVDAMFPYQAGYERFFELWSDNEYTDAGGRHLSPNPLLCAYSNFGHKNDWRMRSTVEFYTAVNKFWIEEYHVDGFRYDHVNGYLDHSPGASVNWGHYRPTFTALQELSLNTYRESKAHQRFGAAEGASRIIQITEDLDESAYHLAASTPGAINGNWEKRLFEVASSMATYSYLNESLGEKLLLTGDHFDQQGYTGTKTADGDIIPALPVQYIESHDECRLMYRLQKGESLSDGGYNYVHGLEGADWYRLQPYAIALMTCVGIPMLWAGQEFAENTGLNYGEMVRVRGYRPLHWDYFYNPDRDSGEGTVLPLVTLYRHLGTLRRQHPALRSPRGHGRQEFWDRALKVLVYRRWQDDEVIVVALNFADTACSVPITFGHTGTWRDVLEASYGTTPVYSEVVTDTQVSHWVSIPSNFGRLLRLEGP